MKPGDLISPVDGSFFGLWDDPMPLAMPLASRVVCQFVSGDVGFVLSVNDFVALVCSKGVLGWLPLRDVNDAWFEVVQ